MGAVNGNTHACQPYIADNSYITKHVHYVKNAQHYRVLDITNLIHAVSWQPWSLQLKHLAHPVSHIHPSVSHSQYHQPYSTLQLLSQDEYCTIKSCMHTMTIHIFMYTSSFERGYELLIASTTDFLYKYMYNVG